MLILTRGFAIIGLGLGLLASIGSCSGGGGGTDGGTGGTAGTSPGSCSHGLNSCNPGTLFCCADYAGLFRASTVMADCNPAGAGGDYSPMPCTTVNLEASCTLYKGTAAEKTIRYYAGYDFASKSDPATNCSALHGFYEAAPP